MIEAVEHGVVLRVRVVPRSGRAGIAGVRDGACLIRVNAAPVDGSANDELIELLSDRLGVPRRAITILSGDRSRQKRLQIDGIDASTAARLLTPA